MKAVHGLVAVSGDAQREELLEALMVDANVFDVVFMESAASASARIRLVTPELVIVLVDAVDAVACHLVSMLRADCDRLGIPVVTCASRSAESDFADIVASNGAPSPHRVAMQMN